MSEPRTDAGKRLAAKLNDIGRSPLSGVSFPDAEYDIVAIEDEAAPEPRVMPRDVLREALLGLRRKDMPDGPCWCSVEPNKTVGPRHEAKCQAARVALAAIPSESDAGLDALRDGELDELREHFVNGSGAYTDSVLVGRLVREIDRLRAGHQPADSR